ncbi:MAG: c-type cytochrome [Aeromicrobium sp.]|nr:c-type cytochrome [Burkholderiales bacterium]
MKSKLLIALLLACAPVLAVAKGNIEEGKKKSEICKACHGEGGAKPVLPEYPILAGQHPDYLAAALNQYKSGKRKNALMSGFSAALSPQDIRDLAAYFAAEPSPLKVKY